MVDLTFRSMHYTHRNGSLKEHAFQNVLQADLDGPSFLTPNQAIVQD